MNTEVDIRTVSTPEAARLLGRSVQTLRLWSCKGCGPIQPVRVNGFGGPLLWRLADIERIISGGIESDGGR